MVPIDKDYKRVQKMAEETLKKYQEVEAYIEANSLEKELRTYPRMSFATNNIFAIQDALGGDITYSDWWEDRFCIGTLTVNGVTYMQYGLTKEKIDGRKGDVCYEA